MRTDQNQTAAGEISVVTKALPAMTQGSIYRGFFDVAPILAADMGRIGYYNAPQEKSSSLSFTNGVFLKEVADAASILANGDFVIDYQTGVYTVKAGATATATVTYSVRQARVSAGLTITGDIEIGAVEMKDATTDTRAKIAAGTAIAEADAALAVKDPAIGTTTGAAVVTDAAGTLQQYLRGLVKILADVWDTTTHYLKIAVTPSALGTDALSVDDSAALEASSVSKAAAGRLYQISGVNTGPDQYIQIHNAAALPANTAIPLIVFFVPTGSNFSLDLGVFGKYFSAGITWCNSSIAATKTIGAADCFVNVQYK